MPRHGDWVHLGRAGADGTWGADVGAGTVVLVEKAPSQATWALTITPGVSVLLVTGGQTPAVGDQRE